MIYLYDGTAEGFLTAFLAAYPDEEGAIASDGVQLPLGVKAVNVATDREKAEKVLRARVLEKMQQEAHGSEADLRKSMVGSGDRSERIRTYNFPQGRVTDHRIGLTLHKLDAILQGFLDEIIEALITTDQAEKLKAVE